MQAVDAGECVCAAFLDLRKHLILWTMYFAWASPVIS